MCFTVQLSMFILQYFYSVAIAQRHLYYFCSVAVSRRQVILYHPGIGLSTGNCRFFEENFSARLSFNYAVFSLLLLYIAVIVCIVSSIRSFCWHILCTLNDTPLIFGKSGMDCSFH